MNTPINLKVFQQVSFDSEADACYITLTSNEESDTIASDHTNCWVDVDSNGNVVGYEILNAKSNFELINSILLSNKPLDLCVSF